MKQRTILELKESFKALGYVWPSFHIIGVRSRENKPNSFDDLIYVIDKEKVSCYPCTTDPGSYWLNHPMNVEGTAVLVPNQYIDTWAIGLHRGKYKALRQLRDVSVYRDNDRDNIAEKGSIQKGLFGINIHRANELSTSVLVDKWSAGCQVISSPKDFKEFLSSCISSKLQMFTYTLLEESYLESL